MVPPEAGPVLWRPEEGYTMATETRVRKRRRRESTAEGDWLARTPRTDERGRARLQVKLGKLHCSFCVATIEKAIGRLGGVEQVSVSLAHEEGLVVYRPEWITAPQIADTLRQVGYSVRDPRKVAGYEAEEAELAEERNRFLAGLATTLVTLALMIFKWAGHLDAVGGGVPGVRPDRPGGAGQDRHADRRQARGRRAGPGSRGEPDRTAGRGGRS
jgi:copper chaperone CopZ